MKIYEGTSHDGREDRFTWKPGQYPDQHSSKTEDPNNIETKLQLFGRSYLFYVCFYLKRKVREVAGGKNRQAKQVA